MNTRRRNNEQLLEEVRREREAIEREKEVVERARAEAVEARAAAEDALAEIRRLQLGQVAVSQANVTRPMQTGARSEMSTARNSGIRGATSAQAAVQSGVPAAGNSRNGPRVTFREEATDVPEFYGERNGIPVEAWIKRVEETARRCKWEDHDTYYAAKQALRGPARDWIDSELEIGTWEDLREGIMKTFKTYRRHREMIENLMEVVQGRDESFRAYVHRVRKMACMMELPEAEVRRFVVDGIDDDPANKILLYTAKSWEQLDDFMETYLSARRNGAHLPYTSRYRRDDRVHSLGRNEAIRMKKHSSRKDDDKNHEEKSEKRAEKRSLSTPPEKEEDIKSPKPPLCWNCNKYGHISRHCRGEDMTGKCWNCKKPGHYSRNCRETRSMNQIEQEKED